MVVLVQGKHSGGRCVYGGREGIEEWKDMDLWWIFLLDNGGMGGEEVVITECLMKRGITLSIFNIDISTNFNQKVYMIWTQRHVTDRPQVYRTICLLPLYGTFTLDFVQLYVIMGCEKKMKE